MATEHGNYEAGAAAATAGADRLMPRSLFLASIDLADALAWYEGWDSANAACRCFMDGEELCPVHDEGAAA